METVFEGTVYTAEGVRRPAMQRQQLSGPNENHAPQLRHKFRWKG